MFLELIREKDEEIMYHCISKMVHACKQRLS
jgi:hypothetical protein